MSSAGVGAHADRGGQRDRFSALALPTKKVAPEPKAGKKMSQVGKEQPGEAGKCVQRPW